MVGSVHDWDEERSVISDKADIGFIDFVNDKSMCNYNTNTEGPVNISIPFPLIGGKPRSGYVGDTIVDSITILNTTMESVDVWSIQIYDSKPEESFTLSVMEPPSADSDVEYVRQYMESFSLEDRVLSPGQTLTVWLSCKPKEIGLHTTAVHLSVNDVTIERLAFVLAEDKLSKSLASNKTFQRERKKKQWTNLVCQNDFVAGSRPPRASQTFRFKLPFYPIPEEIRELLGREQFPEAIDKGLTKENYASYFKHLVIMEEIKMEEDMRGYDMERVSMKSRGQFLTLEVPGLAEKRPSLVYGDFIFAKLATDDVNDTSSPYQGFIHRVEAEVVFLKFEQGFHFRYRASNLYNVQFTYNRINMRRLYQAIEAAQNLEEDFLFPADSRKSRLIQTTPLVPFSRLLNEEQINAVEMILGCRGGAPYVIYGPPGTGKTMTVIEAILQLYTTRKKARILICAPSNSAADYILKKLLGETMVKVQSRDILRLNALTRPLEDIKPDHMKYCFFDEAERLFKCPSFMDLRRYKIIISTYASSSLLYAEGTKRGHFSHIFLDEAGQASEPETMVPLSNLCNRNTVVVLAGDPMQLGPVIYSKDAENFGLGKSYLERLFEFQFYGSSDKNYVIKLVRNYRCHPEILHLPSELFYQGELLACKDDELSSRAWVDLLPNKEFPVLFMGIQGFDEREGSNPSWFNRIEASKVAEIIRDLTESKGLNDEEIGVITPYRQQVLKIKIALEGIERSNIQVGSVEQFQGQERKVIIISTVRSTIKHNEFDRTHCLGFLSNPRRFNVAITRARSLLIIIGNPHIVCKDPYWNKLLWRCSDNGSYKGCFLPEREQLLDEKIAQVDNWDDGQSWNEGEWVQPSEEVGSDQSFQEGEWVQPSEEVGSDQSFQGGEWSQPSGEGGWNAPSGEGGWNAPSGEGGWNAPSGEGGCNAPSGEGGCNAPSGEGGCNAPSGEGGWNAPSGEAGWNAPSGEAGWNAPSGEGGWNAPSGEGGWNASSGEGGWNAPSGEEGWNEPSGEVGWGQDTPQREAFQPDESTEWTDG